jgi:hypothetical protein
MPLTSKRSSQGRSIQRKNTLRASEALTDGFGVFVD